MFKTKVTDSTKKLRFQEEIPLNKQYIRVLHQLKKIKVPEPCRMDPREVLLLFTLAVCCSSSVCGGTRTSAVSDDIVLILVVDQILVVGAHFAKSGGVGYLNGAQKKKKE